MTATASKKMTTPTPTPTRIAKITGSIRKQLELLDGNEHKALTAVLTVAEKLAELRAMTKRTWATQLEDLGLNPRVASRYLMVAKSGLGGFGLIESDFARLPADLLKLEWIAKLTRDQVVCLLGDLDCRKALRSEVIAAVKNLLGRPAPVTKPDFDKQIDHIIVRLVDLVARIRGDAPDRANQAVERVLGALDRVREAATASTTVVGEEIAAAA